MNRGPYARRIPAPRYPMHTLAEARYSYALAYRHHADGELSDEEFHKVVAALRATIARLSAGHS